MLSATLPVRLRVHLYTKLHVRIAVSTLCVRLPTCLSIWCFHSCAVVLSLYMPSLAFCTHCAYASTVCLSVPPWVLFTDRWPEGILGPKLLSCCEDCTLLPASQRIRVAFKEHIRCQPVHVHSHNGTGRAADKSSVHVCLNMNVCVKMCLNFMAVSHPEGLKE